MNPTGFGCKGLSSGRNAMNPCGDGSSSCRLRSGRNSKNPIGFALPLALSWLTEASENAPPPPRSASPSSVAGPPLCNDSVNVPPRALCMDSLNVLVPSSSSLHWSVPVRGTSRPVASSEAKSSLSDSRLRNSISSTLCRRKELCQVEQLNVSSVKEFRSATPSRRLKSQPRWWTAMMFQLHDAPGAHLQQPQVITRRSGEPLECVHMRIVQQTAREHGE